MNMQAIFEQESLEPLLEALYKISDRLEAWAEFHERRSRHLPDSECVADRNSAENYRYLVDIADSAIAKAKAKGGAK